MDLSCLRDQLANQSDKEQQDRLSVFQELILKRFDSLEEFFFLHRIFSLKF